VIHDHREGIYFQESLALLADQRNFTHHRLLSLPHHPISETDPTPDLLYESTRLATYIYSLLVTFPFYPNMAPFDELASLLKSEVSVLDTLDLFVNETRLLIWILVMGGIAAIDTVERLWFVSMLRELIVSVGVSNWEEMRDLLRCFLWLESINDVDGRVLWGEVEACILGGPLAKGVGELMA
jgi:hypothetical protein